MKTIRPMLASKCLDINKLRYPVLGTPKLDGIRCLTIPPIMFGDSRQRCQAVTRNLKPIPNDVTRFAIEHSMEPGFDGELICGTFAETSSAVMSFIGTPYVHYYIFDYGHHLIQTPGYRDPGYLRRVEVMEQLHVPDWCIKLMPVNIPNAECLAAYEAACLEKGYEGVIIRTPESPYKYGRSTVNEQWMLKIKRFEDSEAQILEIIEKQTNNNEPTRNALGYQERSTESAGLSPAGTMGALRVRDVKTGVEFQVGTGFDDIQRQRFWDLRTLYVGLHIKYKFQPHGVKEAPRFPVFIGFRDKADMDLFPT